MAAGGKDNFSSWLSGYLSERGIDVDVYLEYICGIVSASGEDEEEDLISSLEEVLSGAVDVPADWSGVSRTIVDKWKELVLVSSGTQAPVADSIPNLLSEIHDKVLATATQERQVAMATVPSSHSQLDSQEKQRMIKAYGNFEDEDVLLEGEEAGVRTSTTSVVSPATDLLPNVNARAVVDEQRRARERQKQEHEAKVERDKQSREKQLQKEQDRKEKEKKRTQKQERRR